MNFATSGQERSFFYNTLAILLKAVEGSKTTVDLRNESSITGIVDQADGFMNIVMRDCIFTDPRGDVFKFDSFFVQSRNIRYVHIPANIPIIPSIEKQLEKLGSKPVARKSAKRTFREKRMKEVQAKTLAAVNEILENKDKKEAAK